MPASERPRSEPEIISPGHPNGKSVRDGYHFDVRGAERIYITSLGPFSVIVLGLLGTVIAALMLIVLLGTVVVWIPVAILFVAAAMLSNLLRRRDSPDVPELIQ